MANTGQRASLAPELLNSIQAALRERGLDGWLLYDYRGLNPLAGHLLGLREPLSRRYFVLIPAQGAPAALAHAIERAPWSEWPGPVRTYLRRRELEEGLRELTGGRRRLAMEYAPRDALPTVDRVPAGVLELLRETGAEIESSAGLVTLFQARWSDADIESHRRAAALLADIAGRAFREAVRALDARQERTEWDIQQWIVREMGEAGLRDGDATVAAGPNTADPHYEPTRERGAPIGPETVVLIDLWARADAGSVFADQTWMGFTGAPPPSPVSRVWEAVREARDLAIAFLRERLHAGEPVRGCDVDRTAREFLGRKGYGDAFIHRTGHSIDRELHGSGPNLDSLETEDTRRLQPYTGFSIEPGVYLEGEFGIRSEVNAVLRPDGLEITPREPQVSLWTRHEE